MILVHYGVMVSCKGNRERTTVALLCLFSFFSFFLSATNFLIMNAIFFLTLRLEFSHVRKSMVKTERSGKGEKHANIHDIDGMCVKLILMIGNTTWIKKRRTHLLINKTDIKNDFNYFNKRYFERFLKNLSI